MIREDLTKTYSLVGHHKSNPKVGLVPEATSLVIITKVLLFIIKTITTLVREIQVFMALKKVIIV